MSTVHKDYKIIEFESFPTDDELNDYWNSKFITRENIRQRYSNNSYYAENIYLSYQNSLPSQKELEKRAKKI